MPRKAALTPQQARFVAEYPVGLNATQAAIRAGYSRKTAGQIGDNQLKKVEIRAALEKAQAERSERTEITADWVLKRLKEEATHKGEGASHSARVRALEL